MAGNRFTERPDAEDEFANEINTKDFISKYLLTEFPNDPVLQTGRLSAEEELPRIPVKSLASRNKATSLLEIDADVSASYAEYNINKMVPGVDDDELDEIDLEKIDYDGVKKSNTSRNAFGGKLKKNPINREKTHLPDFAKMTTVGKNARTQDSMNRPYDEDFVLGNPFKEAKLSDFLLPDENEYLSVERPRLDVAMQKSMESFRSKFGIRKMLNEGDVDEEFELDIEDDKND